MFVESIIVNEKEILLSFFSTLECFEDETSGVVWYKAKFIKENKEYVIGITKEENHISYFLSVDDRDALDTWEVVQRHFTKIDDHKIVYDCFTITTDGAIITKKSILEEVLECT